MNTATKVRPTVGADKMAVPRHLMRQKVTGAGDRLEEGGGGGEAGSGGEQAAGRGGGVVFRLLKRGNKGKVEARALLIPTNVRLARSVQRDDGAEREEQRQVKQYVLQYESREAEAEVNALRDARAIGHHGWSRRGGGGGFSARGRRPQMSLSAANQRRDTGASSGPGRSVTSSYAWDAQLNEDGSVLSGGRGGHVYRGRGGGGFREGRGRGRGRGR